MVQAIATSSGSGALHAGATVASLEAQLVRYQKQLSDCVNCGSAKTVEGKAAIDALSSKISEVRARIETVTEVKASDDTTPLATGTSTEISANNDTSAAVPKWTTATVGSQVDVQA